jgi:hypothetical protein
LVEKFPPETVRVVQFSSAKKTPPEPSEALRGSGDESGA